MTVQTEKSRSRTLVRLSNNTNNHGNTSKQSVQGWTFQTGRLVKLTTNSERTMTTPKKQLQQLKAIDESEGQSGLTHWIQLNHRQHWTLTFRNTYSNTNYYKNNNSSNNSNSCSNICYFKFNYATTISLVETSCQLCPTHLFIWTSFSIEHLLTSISYLYWSNLPISSSSLQFK